MTKQEVKTKLQEVYLILQECEISIKELNQDGHQFDFCTDARLGDLVDNVANRALRIQNIVYQSK